MSNHLAIAAVTATICHILQESADVDVPGATVATGRPDTLADNQTPRTNVYLYQITPNAAWRNISLPWRDNLGNVKHTPCAAIDLHYLISFTGDEPSLIPQRLLGSTIRSLLGRAALGTDVIASAIADQLFAGALASSDLAQQPEAVRISPQPLSIEEMSKLWAVFPQSAYALSVAYQAAVVLIDNLEVPPSVQTVRVPNIVVQPVQYPSINAVVSAQGRNAALDALATLVITGQSIGSDGVSLLFGNAPTPAPVSLLSTEIAGNGRLQVPLSRMITVAGLLAGPQTVQVVYPMMDAQHPLVAFESNVQTCVLCPMLQGAGSLVFTAAAGSKAAFLTVTVVPNIGVNQRVVLLLNATTPAGTSAAYSINADAGRDDNVSSATFTLTNVAPATYAVRVQIDGAQTACQIDAQTGAITGPTIVVT